MTQQINKVVQSELKVPLRCDNARLSCKKKCYQKFPFCVNPSTYTGRKRNDFIFSLRYFLVKARIERFWQTPKALKQNIESTIVSPRFKRPATDAKVKIGLDLSTTFRTLGRLGFYTWKWLKLYNKTVCKIYSGLSFFTCKCSQLSPRFQYESCSRRLAWHIN